MTNTVEIQIPLKDVKSNPAAESTESQDEELQTKTGVIYGIEDQPPWHLCILLGLQHYLTMFGSTVAVPFIISPALCIDESDPVRGYLISTVFFVSGLVTLLQTTIGTRLPIVQGTTFSFLVPTFAILGGSKWRFYIPEELLQANNLTSATAFTNWNCPTKELMKITNMSAEDVWQPRMREIQGAIIVASLFEVVIGFSGLVGVLLSKITPLTITPTITLVGLSLFREAVGMAGKEWVISITTIVLLIIFSEVIMNVSIPVPGYSRLEKRLKLMHFPIFKLFPVLLTILIMWLICFILTVSNAFPLDSYARTDRRDLISKSDWFRFPYPGQWGLPSVTTASVFGMLAGVLAGIVESIGDYYACARLANAPQPPTHAINRGIGIEGIGCILAGLWGSGNGTTSFSENIGAIGVTKVASRRVVQTAATFMLFLGIFNKFGAVFSTIPDPIVGGMFCVMFSIISAVGLSNLQYVNLNSSRNFIVLGTSIFMGLAIPSWMKSNKSAINTGSSEFDQIIVVLLETSVFVGGAIGFILDNVMPGSAEDRGITKWRSPINNVNSESNEKMLQGNSEEIYGIPVVNEAISNWKPSRYIPFCPSYDFSISDYFNNKGLCKRRKKTKENDGTMTPGLPAIEGERL